MQGWDDAIQIDDTRCEVCGRLDDEDNMLLCDCKCGCEAGYHKYHLDPPLKDIPEGDWFCPNCVSHNSTVQQPAAPLLEDSQQRAECVVCGDVGIQNAMVKCSSCPHWGRHIYCQISARGEGSSSSASAACSFTCPVCEAPPSSSASPSKRNVLKRVAKELEALKKSLKKPKLSDGKPKPSFNLNDELSVDLNDDHLMDLNEEPNASPLPDSEVAGNTKTKTKTKTKTNNLSEAPATKGISEDVAIGTNSQDKSQNEQSKSNQKPETKKVKVLELNEAPKTQKRRKSNPENVFKSSDGSASKDAKTGGVEKSSIALADKAASSDQRLSSVDKNPPSGTTAPPNISSTKSQDPQPSKTQKETPMSSSAPNSNSNSNAKEPKKAEINWNSNWLFASESKDGTGSNPENRSGSGTLAESKSGSGQTAAAAAAAVSNNVFHQFQGKYQKQHIAASDHHPTGSAKKQQQQQQQQQSQQPQSQHPKTSGPNPAAHHTPQSQSQSQSATIQSAAPHSNGGMTAHNKATAASAAESEGAAAMAFVSSTLLQTGGGSARVTAAGGSGGSGPQSQAPQHHSRPPATTTTTTTTGVPAAAAAATSAGGHPSTSGGVGPHPSGGGGGGGGGSGGGSGGGPQMARAGSADLLGDILGTLQTSTSTPSHHNNSNSRLAPPGGGGPGVRGGPGGGGGVPTSPGGHASTLGWRQSSEARPPPSDTWTGTLELDSLICCKVVARLPKPQAQAGVPIGTSLLCGWSREEARARALEALSELPVGVMKARMEAAARWPEGLMPAAVLHLVPAQEPSPDFDRMMPRLKMSPYRACRVPLRLPVQTQEDNNVPIEVGLPGQPGAANLHILTHTDLPPHLAPLLQNAFPNHTTPGSGSSPPPSILWGLVQWPAPPAPDLTPAMHCPPPPHFKPDKPIMKSRSTIVDRTSLVRSLEGVRFSVIGLESFDPLERARLHRLAEPAGAILHDRPSRPDESVETEVIVIVRLSDLDRLLIHIKTWQERRQVQIVESLPFLEACLLERRVLNARDLGLEVFPDGLTVVAGWQAIVSEPDVPLRLTRLLSSYSAASSSYITARNMTLLRWDQMADFSRGLATEDSLYQLQMQHQQLQESLEAEDEDRLEDLKKKISQKQATYYNVKMSEEEDWKTLQDRANQVSELGSRAAYAVEFIQKKRSGKGQGHLGSKEPKVQFQFLTKEEISGQVQQPGLPPQDVRNAVKTAKINAKSCRLTWLLTNDRASSETANQIKYLLAGDMADFKRFVQMQIAHLRALEEKITRSLQPLNRHVGRKTRIKERLNTVCVIPARKKKERDEEED